MNNVRNEHIIQNLRSTLIRERKARHMRQKEIAYTTGVSKSTLTKWEKGGYSDDITLLHFIGWCEALGVKPGNVIESIIDKADTRMEIHEILNEAV